MPIQAYAQKGTAPNGYYPVTYSGATFTGRLESTDNDKQEITLLYVHGSKSERFVGHFEAMCTWKGKDGGTHSFGVSDIPKGTLMTAFYKVVSKKTDAGKTSENSVFAISYLELNGKQLPEEKQLLVFCTEQQSLHFRAFQ